MNEKHIMQTLNMTAGEALTLEKAVDRMEFEALPMVAASDRWCIGKESCGCNGGDKTSYTSCNQNH